MSKAVSVCVRSHMCGRTRDMSVAVNCVVVLQQAAATKEPGSSLYHDVDGTAALHCALIVVTRRRGVCSVLCVCVVCYVSWTWRDVK